MNDPIASDLSSHKEAEELLPWYTTGQLDIADQALVEQHLSGCAECRRQLAFDRRMVDEFAALTPEVDNGWARLRQRLEAPRSWWHRVGDEASAAWRTLARPSVAALAFAQLLLIVVAGSTLLSLSRPTYHALSAAPPAQSANVITMFRPNTTESEIRALLQGNGASLVGGPTPADAYLLRVPAQSRQAVLRRLRSDSHVLMAQPIDGSLS